jgi:hypothetical protein
LVDQADANTKQTSELQKLGRYIHSLQGTLVKVTQELQEMREKEMREKEMREKEMREKEMREKDMREKEMREIRPDLAAFTELLKEVNGSHRLNQPFRSTHKRRLDDDPYHEIPVRSVPHSQYVLIPFKMHAGC